MLKTKLSKIAVVAVVVAIALVGVVASHGSTAHAADYVFTRNLTLGSSGTDVLSLQAYLNHTSCCHVAESGVGSVGNESIYFGPLTRAALAKFQASVGISPAVGYFGPITMAYVNSHGMAMTFPGLPPGCTSTSGFSTTTGQPCNGVSNPNLPAGCTSTVGYSPTTGVKCDSNPSNPPPTNTGPLHGGAGDITVTERNSGTEDQVIENDNKVKVLGFDVEPDGSDANITSVRVELEHTGSGSDRLERYADAVHVMMGSTVVGSADVSSFSKDSNVYSRNIPLSAAVVRDNVKTRFYVAIDAVNNIDSNDLGTDWDIGVGNIRFEDATGATLTDSHDGIGGDITNTFTFEDLATAGDVKLTVNEDDTSINDAHTVQVDDTSDTNDVDILSFTVEARGTDISLMELPIDVTSSGAGVTEIANDFRLMMDGNEVGTAHLYSGVAGSQSCSGTDVGFASTTDTAVCVDIQNIDDDDVVINEGETANFTLVADINDIDGAFSNGDSLSTALDANDIDAEDSNGDAITDLNGSADSTSISFASTGVNLTPGATGTAVETYNETTPTSSFGTFTENVDVTAFEDTVWVALTAVRGSSASTTEAGAHFYIEDPNADDTPVTTGTTTGITLERVSGGTVDGNYVRINSGQTAHLKLTFVYDPASTGGTFRGQLYDVNFATSKAAGTTRQLALPTSDYQTPSLVIH